MNNVSIDLTSLKEMSVGFGSFVNCIFIYVNRVNEMVR